jgi:dTMP kinase
MDSSSQKRGLFVVVEGIDGAGTTTLTNALVDRLTEAGHRAESTAEPTRGPLGAVIRQAIEKRIELDPRALAAAFAADRIDHYHNPVNGILSKLEQGIHIICDRYVMSSLAYQGRAMAELDIAPISPENDVADLAALDGDPTSDAATDWILALNSQALAPDITFYLQVDQAEAWRRIGGRSVSDELFHVTETLRAVADRYDALCDSSLLENHALTPLDANQPAGDVQSSAWEKLQSLLEKK